MSPDRGEDSFEIPDFLPEDLGERASQIEIISPVSRALVSTLSYIENEDVVTTVARAVGTSVGIETRMMMFGSEIRRLDFMGERPVTPDDDTSLDDLLEDIPDDVPQIPPLVLSSTFSEHVTDMANRLGITAEEAFDRLFCFGLRCNFELKTDGRVKYYIREDGEEQVIQGFGHGTDFVGEFFVV
jgi:hypothetical protein